MNNTRKLLNKKLILKFWQKNIEKLGPTRFGHVKPEENECFACGNNSSIERCHIVPKIHGGNDEVSNLHLLCKSCHVESEGLKTYFKWLHYQRMNEWNFPMYYIEKRLKKSGFDIYKLAEKAKEENDFSHEKIAEITKKIIEEMYYT
jgi:hypothetical protein